jgi:hypothetical protein
LDYRGIVVTDINIYKHDPKNFKVRLEKAIPIAELKDIVYVGGGERKEKGEGREGRGREEERQGRHGEDRGKVL